MNNQATDLIQIIDSKTKKDFQDDACIKAINATVITYNPQNKKAVVSFVDDSQNNEYILYNKSGEMLSEGDIVKVYYCTNNAKGWIGIRVGNPNIEEKKNDKHKIIVQSKDFFEEAHWLMSDSSKEVYTYFPSFLPDTLNVENTMISLYPQYTAGHSVSSGSSFEFNGYLGDETPFLATLSVEEEAFFSDKGEYVYSIWTIYSNGEQSFQYRSTILGDGGTWYFNYQSIKLINNTYCAALKNFHIVSSGGTYTYNDYSGFRGIYAIVPNWEEQLIRCSKNDTFRSYAPLEPLYFDNPLVIKLKQFKDSITLPNFETESTQSPVCYYWGDGEITKGYSTHNYKTEGYYIISVACMMNSARRTLWGSSMSDMYECNAKNNIHMITFPKFLDSIDFPNLVASSTMLETVWLSSTATYVNMSFKNCTALQVCPLPPNIVTLGEDTSFRNTAIQKVTLPKSLVTMPDYLYADCHSLKSVVVSCSIGNHIFDGCENLSSLTFSLSTGQTITIGEGAFNNCKSLSSVTFKSGITEIGHLAFAGTGLTKVSLGNSTSYYSDSFPSECKISGGILIS